jgi:hypothetical protein
MRTGDIIAEGLAAVSHVALSTVRLVPGVNCVGVCGPSQPSACQTATLWLISLAAPCLDGPACAFRQRVVHTSRSPPVASGDQRRGS